VFTALLNGFVFLVSEGKRSGGITAVWIARNRFAVLDRTRTVCNVAEIQHLSILILEIQFINFTKYL
jgi:hypothetical protein